MTAAVNLSVGYLGELHVKIEKFNNNQIRYYTYYFQTWLAS